MPRAAAAARARSGERLATARTSACADRANAGSRRSLIRATPRIPQRSLPVVGVMGLSSLAARVDSSSPGGGKSPRSLYNEAGPLTTTGEAGTTPGEAGAGEDGRAIMCLLALFYRVVEDAPVVAGANREEFYRRGGEPPRLLDGPSPPVAGLDPPPGGARLGVNEAGGLGDHHNPAESRVPDDPA